MEKEQLTEFKIQLALPAPTIEIAQEVANKAQVLINQFGYYQFLNLVDFMQKNPGAGFCITAYNIPTFTI